MGAIAGIYSRSRAPVDTVVLDRLAESLARVGPDAEYRHHAGPFAGIHRALFTGRRSRRDSEPFVAPDGSIVLWTGRLDEAPGLRRVREAPPAPAVAFAAYRSWGIDGFARLVGDFTLALWDAPATTLVLCTDALGRYPLYYALTDEWCAWSSTSRSLLRALRLPPAIDEEYVADYILNRASRSAPFKGMSFLPGGHALQVQAGRASVRRYWSLDPRKEIAFASDADYEACFNEVFEQAVADRLDSDDPVFCELSGGVDSSSIACIADRLWKAGRGPEVRTVSYVFNHAISSDERAYIAVVEDHLGRQGLHVSDDACAVLAPLTADAIEPDIPTNQLCFLARQDFVARAMEQSGSRVLLNGLGGDQMFLSEGPDVLALADLTASHRYRALIRSAYAWSRVRRAPFLRTLCAGVTYPSAPARLQAVLHKAARLGDWFGEGFASRTTLATRSVSMLDPVGMRWPSQKYQAWMVENTMRPFALDRYLTYGAADVRYPYLDRRLVEFALALPVDQKLRPGETRSIVRRALRGVLPDAVRERRTKAGPTEAFYRALVRQWPQWSAWLDEPLVAASGLVDRTRFRTALLRARHGIVSNAVQLIKTISLEIWLRSLEAHERSRTGSRAA